jgi:hypothetical protein
MPSDARKADVRPAEQIRSRIPSDDDIREAINTNQQTRQSRSAVLRTLSNALADEFETTVIATAMRIGIGPADELLDYVETLIGTRVLERRLAP